MDADFRKWHVAVIGLNGLDSKALKDAILYADKLTWLPGDVAQIMRDPRVSRPDDLERQVEFFQLHKKASEQLASIPELQVHSPLIDLQGEKLKVQMSHLPDETSPLGFRRHPTDPVSYALEVDWHALLTDEPSGELRPPYNAHAAAQTLLMEFGHQLLSVGELPIESVVQIREKTQPLLEPLRAQFLRLANLLRDPWDGPIEQLEAEAKNIIATNVEPSARELNLYLRDSLLKKTGAILVGGFKALLKSDPSELLKPLSELWVAPGHHLASDKYILALRRVQGPKS